MPDYKSMYLKLFNDVSDIIEALKKAQTEAEEKYIESSLEEENQTETK